LRYLFTSTLFTVVLSFAAFGQSGAPSKKAAAEKSIPRTPDGHPDFTGNWLNNAATPLERPKELAGKITLSDEEVVQMNERARRIFAPNSGSDAASADAYFMSAYNNVKVYKSGGATDSSERVTDLVIDNRTALITDPPDGRMPAFTANGQKRRGEYGRSRAGVQTPPSAQDVAPGDRCITYSVPRINGVYATGLHGYNQIFQTRDDVVLYAENIHEARIVHMNRPHLPPSVRDWSGDSIGHWEGDTLVVDTTNFKSQLHPLAISDQFHMTEKFTRLPGEIHYEVTLDDPDTWVRPWTVMIRLMHTDDRIYETACHEGNEEIMKTILSGNLKK